jgi:hypothetical protein
MPIGVGLEKVSLAQRRDSVAQHWTSKTVHYASWQAQVSILFGSDLVDSILGEQIRPLLQAVGVYHADVTLLQPVHLVPQRYVPNCGFHY